MPQPIKYPWRDLAVGDSAVVQAVPTRQSLYTALRRFRESCRALGYTSERMPRFSLTWREAAGGEDVTITRIEDGPITSGPGMKGRRVNLATDPRAIEHRAILAAIDAHLDAQGVRQRAGLSREMFPLDLVTRAQQHDRAHGSELARVMAELDSPVSENPPSPESLGSRSRRRRKGDDVHTPIPHRADDPDLPHDTYLASRLARSCTSSRA